MATVKLSWVLWRKKRQVAFSARTLVVFTAFYMRILSIYADKHILQVSPKKIFSKENIKYFKQVTQLLAPLDQYILQTPLAKMATMSLFR